MPALNNTIDIQIAVQSTPTATSDALTTILYVGENNDGIGAIQRYSDAAAVEDAGYATSDYEYLAADAAFSQSIKPSQVAIGHVDLVAQQTTILINDTADGNYGAILTPEFGDAETFTHPASGQTAAQIATALAALINASAQFNAAAVSATITVTSATAGRGFTATASVPVGETASTVTTTVANHGYDDYLDDLVLTDTNWYGLCINSRDTWAIRQVSAWTESTTKLFIAQSNEAGILTGSTTDVASLLQDANRQRTVLLYFSDDADTVAEAWASYRLSLNPNQVSTHWAYCTLEGFTADALTTTEQTAAGGKNANYTGTFGGDFATFQGRTSDGTPPDVIVAADWLASAMQQTFERRLLQYSNQGSKIPLTEAGIQVFVGDTKAILSRGVQVGHLSDDPAPVVTWTKRRDMTSEDVAARLIRINFEAYAAGAIESVVLRGTIVANA